MFSLIRTIGGGPKNRYNQDGYNLDLTYITDRIIAMAYPAQGFQSIYRNQLQEVVQFLQSKHKGHYMIINVSNRKYNYEKFSGQIKDYFWPNHQTPQLKTLFEVCHDVTQFLAKDDTNVCAFHCNHGKGRTGTSIISFLLYVRYYKDLETGVTEYNQKRFSSSLYQINIPCQVRYLKYFQQLLNERKIDQTRLRPLILSEIRTKNVKKGDDLFLRLSYVRDKERIGHDIHLTPPITYVDFSKIPMIGDVKAEIYTERFLIGESKVGRINFHTYFTQKFKEFYKTKQLSRHQTFDERLKMTFDGKNIKISWGYSKAQFTFVFDEIDIKENSIKNQIEDKIGKESQKKIQDRLSAQKKAFEFIQKVLRENQEIKV